MNESQNQAETSNGFRSQSRPRMGMRYGDIRNQLREAALMRAQRNQNSSVAPEI